MFFENLRFLFEFKIFLQSKYISGFKKFWGIFVVHNFSKKFFRTWSNFKKTRDYQNWQILTKESELRAINEILLAEKRLLKHYCTVVMKKLRNMMG